MKNIIKINLLALVGVIGLAGGFSPMAEAVGVSQSIGPINFNSAVLRVSGTARVSATATSGLPVTFSSLTPITCKVRGNSVTAVGVGDCTVAANQAGNATYYPAPQVSQTIPVTKGNQVIGRIRFTPSTVGMGGTTTVSAMATSDLPVTFSSSTPSICTVNGTTVTGLFPGLCTVVANQPGDSNYNPVTRFAAAILNIPKLNQTIDFPTIEANTAIGGTNIVTASASSGLPVSFSIDEKLNSICAVKENTVTNKSSGSCTVNANQNGDDKYNAADTKSQTFTSKQDAVTCSGNKCNKIRQTYNLWSTGEGINYELVDLKNFDPTNKNIKVGAKFSFDSYQLENIHGSTCSYNIGIFLKDDSEISMVYRVGVDVIMQADLLTTNKELIEHYYLKIDPAEPCSDSGCFNNYLKKLDIENVEYDLMLSIKTDSENKGIVSFDLNKNLDESYERPELTLPNGIKTIESVNISTKSYWKWPGTGDYVPKTAEMKSTTHEITSNVENLEVP